jgi:hypothetical protein
MKAKYFYGALFAFCVFLSASANKVDFETFLESLFEHPTKREKAPAIEKIKTPTPKDKAKEAVAKEAVITQKIISNLSDIKEKIERISNAAKSAKYFEKKFREKLGAPKEAIFSGYDAVLSQLLSHNLKQFYAEILATKDETSTREFIEKNLKNLINLDKKISSVIHSYDQNLAKIKKILEAKTGKKFPTDTDVINEVLLQQQLPFEKRTIPRTAFAMIGKRKQVQRELQFFYNKTIPDATKKLEAFIKKSKPTIEKKVAEAAKQLAETSRDYRPERDYGSYNGNRWPSPYYRRNGYQPGRYSRDDYGDERGPSYDSLDRDTTPYVSKTKDDNDKKDYGFEPTKRGLKQADKKKKKDDKKTIKPAQKKRKLLAKYTDELEELDKAGTYELKKILWKIDPNALVKTNEILSKISRIKMPLSQKLKNLMAKISTFVDGKSSRTLQEDLFPEQTKKYDVLKKANPKKFEEVAFPLVLDDNKMAGIQIPKPTTRTQVPPILTLEEKIKRDKIAVQYHLFKKNIAELGKIKGTLKNMKITPPEQKGEIKILEAYRGIFKYDRTTKKIIFSKDRYMVPDTCTGEWRSIVSSALEKIKQFDPKNPVLNTGYFAHGEKAEIKSPPTDDENRQIKLYIKYKIGNETCKQIFEYADPSPVTLDPKKSVGT